jgi:hypothetical protein
LPPAGGILGPSFKWQPAKIAAVIFNRSGVGPGQIFEGLDRIENRLVIRRE